jgi:hypothetical protein
VPGLNQVEGFFGILDKQSLGASDFKSIAVARRSFGCCL